MDPSARRGRGDVVAVAAVGAFTADVAVRYPLIGIARAHEHVDAGSRGRVLLTVSD